MEVVMESLTINVANVKCKGCVSNIQSNLPGTGGVEKATVELSGEVTIEGNNLDLDQIAAKLAELGYPKVDA